MKSNYRMIDDLVTRIDERNTDGRVNKLVGVSIDKCFINSVANVVGTDLTKYKIIRKKDFAVSLMQVSRDEKIPVAMLQDYDEAIMSPAYPIFRVKNEDDVLPEYLEMWFKRPEFDREASFIAVGGVRGSMPWEEFGRMKLPIPPIDRQRKIVEAYKIISKRIEIKRKINDNLAETAQAIFKRLFIDATSEGMPITWAEVPLYEVADLGAGGDRPEAFSDAKTSEFPIPIFSNGIENEGLYGYTDKPKVQAESVTISARGTVGYVFLRQEPFVPIVRLIYITPKDERVTAKYLFFALRYAEMNSTGTSQQQITVPDIKNTPIIVPNADALAEFMCRITPLFNEINCIKGEIDKLKTLQAVMLQTISS